MRIDKMRRIYCCNFKPMTDIHVPKNARVPKYRSVALIRGGVLLVYLQVNDRHTCAAQRFGTAELIPDSLVPCHLRRGNTLIREDVQCNTRHLVPCDLRAATGARFGVSARPSFFKEREIDVAPSLGGYNNAPFDGLMVRCVIICRPALCVHVHGYVYPGPICTCTCI